MAKQKFNINIFDYLVMLAIIAIGLIVLFAYNNKPNLGERVVQVEIIITDPITIRTILPTIKLAKEVFYSSTKYPVEQVSYKTELDTSGAIDHLDVTLQGPGTINEGDSIFNGQRVYANQKVEIRSDYFAQGYVTSFNYAD